MKCCNCKKKIDSREPNCPFCGQKQSPEARAKDLRMKLVEIECPKCGCKQSFFASCDFFDIASCVECGVETYSSNSGKMKMKYVPPKPAQVDVKCPYCNSTNTKKISTVSKAAGVALFGVFAAGKVVHQWHCNNCKSDF